MSGKGFLGGMFDNDELLWFIILFLLLFFNNRSCGCGSSTGPVADVNC